MNSIKIVEKRKEPKILVRQLKDIKHGSIVGFVSGVKVGDELSIEQAKKAMDCMTKGIVLRRDSSNLIEVLRFGESFNSIVWNFKDDYTVIEFEYHLHLNYIFQ